jgi:hypothetical protein
LKRWNPLFEPLPEPLFDVMFPGRGASLRRAPAICDCPRCDMAVLPRDMAVLPRGEKKCWFCATFRVVEAAAGRPLAEKLSRVGGIGTLPVEKRAFWNCA